jgi:transmembrane sensor
MFNDRFSQLIARKLSGEASEEDLRELELILIADPQAGKFLQLFTDFWTLEPSSQEDNIQEDVHFQQILSIAEKQATPMVVANAEPVSEEETTAMPPRWRIGPWLAAAAVVGVIILSFFWWTTMDRPKATMALNEVTAATGARSFLLLPDGTRVWLNSESRIEYKSDFNDTIREVLLEGEAFFDVVKDKSRPFIVHTSDIDIRVLGTAFNVKSYPREDHIEATLIHGLIEVTNKMEPTSPKVILRPHEKLVFTKLAPPQSNDVVKSSSQVSEHRPFSITALRKNISDSALVETSWVYNKLIFDGESFREMAGKMERWYDVKIIFRSDNVAASTFHVAFTDETIEEALKALQLIQPFTYKKNGNEIEILNK